MYEFLFELLEMNTLYALYMGIILSLTFKYIWVWNTEHFTTNLFPNAFDKNNLNSPLIILKMFSIHSNLLYNWIIQIVRRKEISSDDTDSFVFF